MQKINLSPPRPILSIETIFFLKLFQEPLIAQTSNWYRCNWHVKISINADPSHLQAVLQGFPSFFLPFSLNCKPKISETCSFEVLREEIGL
jgi:hypothetical protein